MGITWTCAWDHGLASGSRALFQPNGTHNYARSLKILCLVVDKAELSIPVRTCLPTLSVFPILLKAESHVFKQHPHGWIADIYTSFAECPLEIA